MTRSFTPSFLTAVGGVLAVVSLIFLVGNGWTELAALLLGILGGLAFVTGLRIAHAEQTADVDEPQHVDGR